MKITTKLFFLILFLPIILHPSISYASEEVIVISSGYTVYKDTLRGFKSVCNNRIKEYRLQDYSKDALINKISKSKPRLILAIGYDALEIIKEIKNIPIISVMVLNLKNAIPDNSLITGIDITLSIEQQLDAIRLVLPGSKRLGVIYNPSEIDYLLEEAGSIVSQKGFALISYPVEKPEEIISAINNFKIRYQEHFKINIKS